MEVIVTTHTELQQLIQSSVESSINKFLSSDKFRSTSHIEPDERFDINELVAYDPEKRSKPTFYRYVSEGKIPSHKSTKKLWFLKSEIDAWLKAGKSNVVKETQSTTDAFLGLNRKANTSKNKVQK